MVNVLIVTIFDGGGVVEGVIRVNEVSFGFGGGVGCIFLRVGHIFIVFGKEL